MPKNSYLERKSRHDMLIGLLRSRDAWTTSELSRTLSVSMRTLMRDLRDLKISGLPIETDRGRGGGLRLQQSWGLGKLQLSYEEVLDLLIALATMEKFPSPLLMKNLRRVRMKIAQSFPESQRRIIARLRQRVWVGEKASNTVLANVKPPKAEIHVPLQQGFFECRQLQIKYVDEKRQLTERRIEPHYFMFNWPVWYILAWDQLRSDIRFFRVDRIVQCVQTESRFRLRDKNKFTGMVAEFFESV